MARLTLLWVWALLFVAYVAMGNWWLAMCSAILWVCTYKAVL